MKTAFRLLVESARWRGIARALLAARGNHMDAARRLGITRNYLLRLLHDLTRRGNLRKGSFLSNR